MGGFGVVEGRDQEEAEAETAAAVPITVGDDFESLEPSDDVFAGAAAQILGVLTQFARDV